MRQRGVKGPKRPAAGRSTPIPQVPSSASRKAAGAAAFASLLFGSAAADAEGWYEGEYARCDGTTIDIVQCLDRRTAAWQARLEQAYGALLAQEPAPDRNEQLQQAQERWADYRKANCTYYRAGSGTIAAIEAAECMRVLTMQRALELEQAASQEGL